MSSSKVVILNWNGEAYLRRFLPSVVSHTPAGVGVVVADNGSTDGSLELLAREFPSVEVLTLGVNHGFAKGYNEALKRLDAEYFILLNSDVECTAGWCEPLLDVLDRDPWVAAVAPKLLSASERWKFEYAGASGGFIDALGYPFCRGRILSRIEGDAGQYDDRRDVFWATGACMALRSSAFRDAGGFDEWFFAHMEEIDLCWRLQKAGFRIVVEPASVVYHLGGGTLGAESPRKTYLNFRNNLAMLYKNLPQEYLWPVLIARMVLDGIAAIEYLFRQGREHYMAVWNAHRDFWRWRRDYKRQGGGSWPATIYKGAVVLNYGFGYKKFSDLNI